MTLRGWALPSPTPCSQSLCKCASPTSCHLVPQGWTGPTLTPTPFALGLSFPTRLLLAADNPQQSYPRTK